ncbi:glutathione S-transferase [Chromatiales bacterium (ex Bugula neritina AB1)]|nr:glutathione S-transferase [Chromatiales bacterium (ex Bugula neritina AB1)]
MHLYITYKRYSSWSLRPWLAMKVTGIPFDETVLPFAHDNSLNNFARQHSIPATVPVLECCERIIWDSLAILEFLAEQHPDKNLWPRDPALRALARSACAEMHSGFAALRSEHPMNCHRVIAMEPSAAVQADLKRLADIWQLFERADKPDGDFLCGEFSIADAMFAPVAWRAIGYQLSISPLFKRWSDTMMNLDAMNQWVADGAVEEWRVEETENIGV